MPVIMCKQCAGAIRYDADREPENTPETHSDINQDCEPQYRE